MFRSNCRIFNRQPQRIITRMRERNGREVFEADCSHQQNARCKTDRIVCIQNTMFAHLLLLSLLTCFSPSLFFLALVFLFILSFFLFFTTVTAAGEPTIFFALFLSCDKILANFPRIGIHMQALIIFIRRKDKRIIFYVTLSCRLKRTSVCIH